MSATKKWDFDLVAMHGQQEVTDEDRKYRGSRYADVRKALYANPYRGGASGQQPGPLPMFRSTIRNVWATAFRHASARSLDSRADLRWGKDGMGYRRIIAPNGICVLGYLGDHRGFAVFRLFQERLEGADDRKVLI